MSEYLSIPIVFGFRKSRLGWEMPSYSFTTFGYTEDGVQVIRQFIGAAGTNPFKVSNFVQKFPPRRILSCDMILCIRPASVLTLVAFMNAVSYAAINSLHVF